MAAQEASTLAIANLDGYGHAEYDFYVRGTADWQWDPAELPDPIGADVTALHVGSLALAMAPGADVLEEWVARQRERVVVGYDPNIRPALAGERAAERARVERQIALADVVKASDDDVYWLYSENRPPRPQDAPEADGAAAPVGADPFLEEAARSWLALGPAVVAVTRGAAGTLVIGRGAAAPMYLTPEPIEIVDTVGAGDAFNAGLLDALGQAGALGAAGRARLAALTPDELAVCVGHAQRVAAHACRRVGADPGELEPAPLEFPGRGATP